MKTKHQDSKAAESDPISEVVQEPVPVEVVAVKECFHNGMRQRVGTRFVVFEHQLNSGMVRVSDLPSMITSEDTESESAENSMAPSGAEHVI